MTERITREAGGRHGGEALGKQQEVRLSLAGGGCDIRLCSGMTSQEVTPESGRKEELGEHSNRGGELSTPRCELHPWGGARGTPRVCEWCYIVLSTQRVPRKGIPEVISHTATSEGPRC